MESDDVLYFVGYAHGYRGDYLSAKPGPLRQGWEDGGGDLRNGSPPDAMFDCRLHHNRPEIEVTVTGIRNPLEDKPGEHLSMVWIFGTHEHEDCCVYSRLGRNGWQCLKARSKYG